MSADVLDALRDVFPRWTAKEIARRYSVALVTAKRYLREGIPEYQLQRIAADVISLSEKRQEERAARQLRLRRLLSARSTVAQHPAEAIAGVRVVGAAMRRDRGTTGAQGPGGT